MFTETQLRFNPKARVPFVNQLAREFGVSKGHVWAVCAAGRASPRRASIIKRQQELLQGGLPIQAAPPREDRSRNLGRTKDKGSRLHTALFTLLAQRRIFFPDLAAQTGYQVSTLHQLASGTNRSWRARRAVEQAIGVTIWTSSPTELQPVCSSAAQASQPDCSSIPSAAAGPDAPSN
jgi:hypothetical protein